jgi:hypothetical protein
MTPLLPLSTHKARCNGLLILSASSVKVDLQPLNFAVGLLRFSVVAVFKGDLLKLQSFRY